METVMPVTSTAADDHASAGTGGRLVTTEGRTLPLREAHLRADASGGLARVVLEQRFANPWPEPLRVTYRMPLPADGAVSGYAFTIGERRITGEVDRKQKARQRFEEALVEGRTAGLVEQERPDLFTQELGNVPPGAEVIAELTIDMPLAWLEDRGAWEWRFPTSAAPRYLGTPGRVKDAEQVTIDVSDKPLAVRMQLSLAVRDAIAEGTQAHSPSHAMHVEAAREGRGASITLASEEGAALDRDVVVRWSVAAREPGISLDVTRPAGAAGESAAFGLVTIVPPAPEAHARTIPRDLIFLLDTSGSMSGPPLDQARRVAGALVDTLGPADHLEMIEFGSSPRRWKSGAAPATEANKSAARKWLAALRASGGTEMRTGVLEALAPLRADAQRQIVLITDGQIGFEQEVVEAVMNRLPAGSRLHTVGVGSAVNRSLTGPAARGGKGVEVIIGIGEDAEPAARRLLARTSAPVLVELGIDGNAVLEQAPSRLPDVFAGSPVRAAIALRPEGGSLRVRGVTATGTWEQHIEVAPIERGAGSAAVAKLFGRERVEDLEMRIAAGHGRSEIDRAIERLGIEHQIATRLTSWVAIDQIVSVDPTAPTRHERMPQELPHGQSMEGLGLRRAMTLGFGGAVHAMQPVPSYSAAPPPAAAPRMRIPAPAPKAESANQGQSLEKDAGGPSGSGGSAGPADAPAKVHMTLAMTPGVRMSRAARDALLKQLGHVVLAGRITARTDDELTIELTIDAEIDLRHPPGIRLRLADGTFIDLALDTAHSTREGKVSPGQIVRLRLCSPSPLPSTLAGPVRLGIEQDGAWLITL